MFRLVSGRMDYAVWYESTSYEDCEEYLHNCEDVADEQELFIVGEEDFFIEEF